MIIHVSKYMYTRRIKGKGQNDLTAILVALYDYLFFLTTRNHKNIRSRIAVRVSLFTTLESTSNANGKMLP